MSSRSRREVSVALIQHLADCRFIMILGSGYQRKPQRRGLIDNDTHRHHGMVQY